MKRVNGNDFLQLIDVVNLKLRSGEPLELTIVRKLPSICSNIQKRVVFQASSK